MTTLSTDEMARIRLEVFDNLLNTGAMPYISVLTVYQVIQANVLSSDTPPTTSSTTVSAVGPTTLTLASATGLTAGIKVQLDVDGARETVTVRNVSGLTISVICNALHSGTYPVEIESPLTIVRGILADLSNVEQRLFAKARSGAGIKQVDEIVFFGGNEGRSRLDEIAREQLRLRWQLAATCGLTGILREALGRIGGGTTIEVY